VKKDTEVTAAVGQLNGGTVQKKTEIEHLRSSSVISFS
jgi:hypothetical protein